MKITDLLTELSDCEADKVVGGMGSNSEAITVFGPRGLVKKLENPGVDAPGLTPEKGQKIASNSNGKKMDG